MARVTVTTGASPGPRPADSERPPGPRPRGKEDNKSLENNTFDVSDGDVPAAGPLGRSGKNKGICSFFLSRSARHVLVEEGTRSYLTLPTISHSLLNVSPLQQQHFLDDQRKFATFIYIRRRFATSCSTFPNLTPSNPRYPCAIHSTTDDNEATAAPHRARSHGRAGSHRRAVSY